MTSADEGAEQPTTDPTRANSPSEDHREASSAGSPAPGSSPGSRHDGDINADCTAGQEIGAPSDGGPGTGTGTSTGTGAAHVEQTQNTQPATQPLSPKDLRHSGLTPADIGDVLCVLHPASAAAEIAVRMTHEKHPGNVLYDQLGQSPPVESTTPAQQDAAGGDHGALSSRDATQARPQLGPDDNGDSAHATTATTTAKVTAPRPVGIALRLSQFSSLVNPSRGWVFGRNARLADVCIADLANPTYMSRRVSNRHFRIFVNGHGILMLEDTSINGTIVEGTQISSRKKGYSGRAQRVLTQGCTIQVLIDQANPINFVVRFPARPHDIQCEFDVKYREWVLSAIQAGHIEPPESECVTHQAAVAPAARASPSPAKRVRRGAASGLGAGSLLSVPSANQTHGMNWSGAPDYSVVAMIGKGAFATVFKIAAKDNGRIYACKELDKRGLLRGRRADKMMSEELRIMERLRHPHIVQFHQSHTPADNPRYLYLIMEYVRHGELATYLADSPNGRLPESEVQLIAAQVMHAIHYLHAENVTHRDIKPENILISSLEPLRVKLSDFGLSKIADVVTSDVNGDEPGGRGEGALIGGTFLKTFCGTLLYCAPEVYPGFDRYRKRREAIEARDESQLSFEALWEWSQRRKRRPRSRTYDQSVDIWSYAAVMFHLLTGRPPFAPTAADRQGAAMLRKIMTTDPNWHLLEDIGASQLARDFLQTVIRRFPEERPSDYAIISLAWLQSVDSETDYQQFVDKADQARQRLGKLVPRADEHHFGFDERGEYCDEARWKRRQDRERHWLQEFAQKHGFSRAAYIRFEKDLMAKHLEEPVDGNDQSLGSGSAAHSSKAPPSEGGDPPVAVFSDEIPQEPVQHDDVPQPPVDQEAQAPQTPAKSVKRQRLEDFARSIAITASLSLKHWDPDWGARPSLDERNVFAHGIRIAGGNGREPTPATSPRKRNPSSGDLGYDRPIKSARTDYNNRAENARPDARSGTETSNGRGKRRDVSGRRPPEVRLAEISPHEREPSSDELQPATSTVLQVSAGHPNPFGALERRAQTRALRAPYVELGKLVPVQGSFYPYPVSLHERLTSWGRGLNASIQYPDPYDHRVPKYALEVAFWAPRIEEEIANGVNWKTVPRICTILGTQASGSIYVNGVELRKENKQGTARCFGKIYSGDIITIYKDKTCFLAFRCVLFHGEGRMKRPVRERPFRILEARYPDRGPHGIVYTGTGEHMQSRWDSRHASHAVLKSNCTRQSDTELVSESEDAVEPETAECVQAFEDDGTDRSSACLASRSPDAWLRCDHEVSRDQSPSVSPPDSDFDYAGSDDAGETDTPMTSFPGYPSTDDGDGDAGCAPDSLQSIRTQLARMSAMQGSEDIDEALRELEALRTVLQQRKRSLRGSAPSPGSTSTR
ncbi:hypothetical protein KEM52_003831 [Ascosphaera acerosa]|nr:hypothetical protein KEM52_003831 [Ascosphaera acerosa]